VLPDIKKKMPRNNNIILQQDGAAAHHLPEDNSLFKPKVEELFSDKNAVILYTQPAQSQDLNVNDLGFFASLQSIYYYKISPKNSIELLTEVNKLNNVRLTLQSHVMNKIIESKGDKNKYYIPHMNKQQILERINQQPSSLLVTPQEAHNYDLDILLD
jgi:hypothetical protein